MGFFFVCDQVNDAVRYVTEYITYLNGILWCDQLNNTVRYVTEYINHLNSGFFWCVTR